MSWSRDDPATGRRGYHHGNLREALIRAALDLIAEKGPAGFTFADAARSGHGCKQSKIGSIHADLLLWPETA